MSYPNELGGFIPRLESLRGLAALSVLGFHAYGNRHDTNVGGMAPVVLFFVLSGFVLARSLDRNADPLNFFRNRVFRLFPAAAASVFLLTVLYWQFDFYIGFPTSHDWTNIILNALMIRSDINGVMWSLTVECVASPLIFASFLARKAYGNRPLIVVCAILFGLSFWGDYVHLLGGFTSLAPLYSFVVGVALHFAAKDAKSPSYVLGATTVGLAVLLFCGLRKHNALTILGDTIGSGALIYLIATAKNSRVFFLLDARPVRFLGKISFSFYLLHPIALGLANRSGAESALALFILAAAYTFPMAWISWREIECRFIDLRRRFRSSTTVRATG
jgi:peptidoglycan/LPS O-acetylase OafA/YrhL